MSRKNKLVLCAMLFLGVIIFWFSVRGVSFRSLMGDISNLKWQWIVVALLCMCISLFFEAIIVKKLIRQQIPHYHILDALRVPLVEQLFNGITPFSTGGQPAQLIALMQSGVDAGRATSSMLMKFIIYQAMIVVNFIICLLIGFHYIADKIHLMAWLLVFGFLIHFMVIISLIMIMFWYDFTKKIVKIVLLPVKKFSRKEGRYEQLEETVNEKIDSFYQESLSLKANKRIILEMCLLTLVQLFFYYIIPYFILVALGESGVNIILVTTLNVLIVMVVSLFPVPGGAGGAEYSFSVVFSTFITQNSKLVLAMIIWRIITYYFGMFSGMVALVIKPIATKLKSK
ncbi:flippase-like domain-containing protein [Ligilactobacillus sp. WILCCON 0076]|uniref:Phosphatidylglycerol lysyltransferase n=1 Tax=Ligilactobacillus ubinensis TaxID=2876789 RepID=A0A9X2FMN6_9LACO|nr:lysylphosphatidylglycerol synthase transmembrane domain-containing protein [Ligilactobacillus ubinensis]MCP0887920.1 flippase-like domain-containing protein [Ligilactobacillus ubinensis]